MWETDHVRKLNLISAFLTLCVDLVKLIQEWKENFQLGSFVKEGTLANAGFTKASLRSRLQTLKVLMLNI